MGLLSHVICTYLDLFKGLDGLWFDPLVFLRTGRAGIDPYLPRKPAEVVAGGRRGYTHSPSEAVNYNQLASELLRHESPGSTAGLIPLENIYFFPRSSVRSRQLQVFFLVIRLPLSLRVKRPIHNDVYDQYSGLQQVSSFFSKKHYKPLCSLLTSECYRMDTYSKTYVGNEKPQTQDLQ